MSVLVYPIMSAEVNDVKGGKDNMEKSGLPLKDLGTKYMTHLQ